MISSPSTPPPITNPPYNWHATGMGQVPNLTPTGDGPGMGEASAGAKALAAGDDPQRMFSAQMGSPAAGFTAPQKQKSILGT